MLYDITINLLPGIAEKERKLREQQKRMVQIIGLLIVDGIFIFLVLLLTFHNIALGNNLSLLNKKTTDLQTEIQQYNGIEQAYTDLQKRITLIENVKKTRKEWPPLMSAIAEYTLKNVQLTRYSLNSSTVTVVGIAPSTLQLAKQKEAYKLTALIKDYKVAKRDTWQSIAKNVGITYEKFLELHKIDPTIQPTEGQILKIRKPLFSDVVIVSMSDAAVGQPVTFQLSLPLEKGAL